MRRSLAVRPGVNCLSLILSMICLATAHPAKFSDAIADAIGEAAHHEILDGLLDAPARCESLPNDRAAVCDFIAARG